MKHLKCLLFPKGCKSGMELSWIMKHVCPCCIEHPVESLCNKEYTAKYPVKYVLSLGNQKIYLCEPTARMPAWAALQQVYQEKQRERKEKVISRYESMFSGVFYDRFIKGEWVKAEGLVYPMFNEEKNIVHGNPDGPGVYYISIDYGTKNPTAMGFWRVWHGECVMEPTLRIR